MSIKLKLSCVILRKLKLSYGNIWRYPTSNTHNDRDYRGGAAAVLDDHQRAPLDGGRDRRRREAVNGWTREKSCSFCAVPPAVWIVC